MKVPNSNAQRFSTVVTSDSASMRLSFAQNNLSVLESLCRTDYARLVSGSYRCPTYALFNG